MGIELALSLFAISEFEVEFFMSQYWQGPLLIGIVVLVVLIVVSGVDNTHGG